MTKILLFLLSQIRASPNLEGQVPLFISPTNSVAQLHPQALGSLFVTSYDSHGYGGGIQVHLSTGLISQLFLDSRNIASGRTHKQHRFHRHSNNKHFCFHIICRSNVFAESLSRNGRLLRLSFPNIGRHVTLDSNILCYILRPHFEEDQVFKKEIF
jgi:hypothetical protein